MRTQDRIAAVLLLLATAGLGVSLATERVHRRLQADPGYTSFCNVNAQVNCDVVLTSPYATLLGVPLSRWALLFYAGVLLAAVVFVRSRDPRRRAVLARALFVAQAWGLLLAAYLAGVAVLRLQTVCLLCTGLYLVGLALLPTAWWLLRATASPPAAWLAVLRQPGVRPGLGAAVLGVVAVALLQARGAALPRGSQDPAAVCAAEPDFCRWFEAQPRLQIPLDGGHHRGPETAAVTIVEFSDFACAHCRGFRDALEAVRARSGEDMRIVFRHFPLDRSCNAAVASSLHPDACLAAVAAECAGEQGRFWAYHDVLFDHQRELGRAHLLAYAERLGLDLARFRACLGSEAARARVEADTRVGAALGVESTPTVFLNGRRIAGALDRRRLDSALILARGGR